MNFDFTINLNFTFAFLTVYFIRYKIAHMSFIFVENLKMI